MASDHWTDELFVRHEEAFLAIHEHAWARGEEQARDLQTLLDRFGLPVRGRILDAPCGIGRHGTRLARLGDRVVGVDLSPRYIDRARELAGQEGVEGQVTYVVGDMRRLKEAVPPNALPFDAALNLWTSLGYYGEDGDEEILRGYRDLVRPGGVLVVYVVNRDIVVRHPVPQTYEAFGDVVLIQEDHLELGTSWMRNEWRFFRRRGKDLDHLVTVHPDHRIYSLHELRALLERSGWAAEATFADFKMNPPSPDASTLLVVGRR